MFAAALAGVFNPDLAAEMKSRGQRALEQLEPSDVIVLRGIGPIPTPVPVLPPGTTKVPLAMTVSGQALIAAGCVVDQFNVPGNTGPYRTEVGEAVIALVRTWTPSKDNPPAPA